MRIEDLEELDIRRYNRDQVAFIPLVQLCRTEPPEGAEDLIADQRQQLERDKVVAGLFPVSEPGPKDGENNDRRKKKRRRRTGGYSQDDHRAENGNHRGAKMPQPSHQDRQRHIT